MAALGFCRGMIFSENRLPPRIKSGAGFFRIMPQNRRRRPLFAGSGSAAIAGKFYRDNA